MGRYNRRGGEYVLLAAVLFLPGLVLDSLRSLGTFCWASFHFTRGLVYRRATGDQGPTRPKEWQSLTQIEDYDRELEAFGARCDAWWSRKES